jgi:peptidoglycan/LPS O-acetylase OafA/YrhL
MNYQATPDAKGTVASASAYRPEIDGLRCIAVLAVIFYHAHFTGFSGGYVGVDVFFVISGFLITGIIHRETRERRYSFLNFYERRMRRIFPALFLVLAACLIPAWYLETPAELRSFSQSLVAVSTFLSNWFFYFKTGYFGANADEVPLLHTWSLAVEEQFYVVFPIILILIERFAPRRLTLLLAGLWLASFGLCLTREAQFPLLNFFSAASRGFELLTGGILAIEFERVDGFRRSRPALAEGLALLGVAAIAFSIVWMNEATPFPGRYALIPVGGSALLIAFTSRTSYVGRVLASTIPVFIGQVSYSAYLWHQPLYAFARLASPDRPPVWVMLALIALTIVLSYLSWRFVEQPFRNKAKVSRRTVFILSACASLFFIALGAIGHLENGFPQRFTKEQASIMATAAPSPYRDRCETDGVDFVPPAKACRYFGKHVTWAVMGDSHTIELAYDLALALKPSDMGLVQLSNSGCPPALLFQSEVPGCTAWTKQAVDYLVNDKTIVNVVLVYRHSFHLYGGQLDYYPALPNEHPTFLRNLDADAAREMYWKSFVALIDRLRAAGKRVYVVDPVPELSRSIEWNIYRHGASPDAIRNSDGLSVDYYRRRNAFILGKLQTLPWDRDLIRIPTREAFCGPVICRAIVNGRSLYFDDSHPSLTGAEGILGLFRLGAAAAPAR